MSNDEDCKWRNYTNEQLTSKLEALRKDLQCNSNTNNFNVEKKQRQQQLIKLLHDYNEIKDATQIVLGALAHMHGLTIKDMHKKYDLPLEDA